MDDYAQDVLTSARDEYLAQLIMHMERCLMPWLDEVFAETSRLCVQNRQPGQYLKDLQAAMEFVKDWNAVALEKETARVLRQCPYMAELLSCAVVTLIKLLSCGRTTDRRKNIRLETPPLAQFVHRTYINVARQVYIHPYLFELLPDDLQRTKQRAERERVVRGCILDTVRNGLGIPTEAILRAYLDVSVENEEQVYIEPVMPAERDEVEELENAKRRALGQAPVHAAAAAGSSADGGISDAVLSNRRHPDPAMDEGGGGGEGGGDFATSSTVAAVANADDRPVVSRVEFSPHEEVYSIPAREEAYDSDGDDDDDYYQRPSRATAVPMDLSSANLQSIDDLF